MIPTYGLVVCGGKSTRMGSDKSMLNYHGQPQRYHLYQLLGNLCERVFISCNQEQVASIPANYEVIIDAPEYANTGPMAAMLSAFKMYPNAHFLAVGCDYPLIDISILQQLLKVSHQFNFATSYYNTTTSFYEPLLSHYQSNIKEHLENYFKQKNYSLQALLKEIKANIIVPDDLDTIKSIDTLDEYKKVLKQL